MTVLSEFNSTSKAKIDFDADKLAVNKLHANCKLSEDYVQAWKHRQRHSPVACFYQVVNFSFVFKDDIGSSS